MCGLLCVVACDGWGLGVLCFVGLSARDTTADQDYMKRKILSLRLWDNAQTGKAWDKSVSDMKYEVLIGTVQSLLWWLDQKLM